MIDHHFQAHVPSCSPVTEPCLEKRFSVWNSVSGSLRKWGLNGLQFFWALSGVCLWLIGNPLVAQDKVTFTPDGVSRPITLVGEILDYTGQNLRMKTLTGEPKTIPSASIEGIETHYSTAHLDGIEQYRNNETASAIQRFEAALREESRGWVDRELYAWLLKCHHRQGNLPAALAAFQQITTEDPYTRHWNLAPLMWTPVSVSPQILSQARQWLIAKNDVSQFIGASLLLLDADVGDNAERLMQQLARNANPNISALAKCQLWRLQLSVRTVDDFTLNRWQDQLDYVPDELRNGPKFLLASGLAIHHQYRKAAAEYMWIPLVYSENQALAARALWEAALVLQQTELNTEATQLYLELTQRYPWSSEASFSKEKLSELSKD